MSVGSRSPPSDNRWVIVEKIIAEGIATIRIRGIGNDLVVSV